MPSATETAEQRFRLAFERLKAGKPKVLPPGAAVSQNNVAKEAGTDPTALRKCRYPSLIREIQAWVEINDQDKALQKKRQGQRNRAREELTAKIQRLKNQHDHAQSELISAKRRTLELLQENVRLQSRLDELLPPITPLRK